ncbi:MAG: MaoC family dehydratase [Pseudomonadota bacterium]
MKAASPGPHFEDFAVGDVLQHPWPRTVSDGDSALYLALTGHRTPLAGNDLAARRCGLPRAPLEPMLVFHIVFGMSVPDVSHNAIANLGYADVQFRQPVYPGDTLSASSAVIGVKANSDGTTGVVYVRTTGVNQHGAVVLSLARWVMVPKRDPQSASDVISNRASITASDIPTMPEKIAMEDLGQCLPTGLDLERFDPVWTGSQTRLDDLKPGTIIDHHFGTTIAEAEHMMAVRLFQNTARVHVDATLTADSRFGRRVAYGGHVISLAMALSRYGMETLVWLVGIEAGRHTSPVFAEDTIYAWTEVLEVLAFAGRTDLAALRLRLIAAKSRGAVMEGGGIPEETVLDMRYVALIPQ